MVQLEELPCRVRLCECIVEKVGLYAGVVVARRCVWVVVYRSVLWDEGVSKTGKRLER